ncbi:hypothetical protein E2C01_045554 [Portunus trituberculatus]|uniref:Uncharacterized protein n=1 Tax=Portunus trituberculatus TaxID=210409 RepID=A0A5B7FYM8_PORTR|nr:hypothetical protein [Portunus trituberculatus]
MEVVWTEVDLLLEMGQKYELQTLIRTCCDTEQCTYSSSIGRAPDTPSLRRRGIMEDGDVEVLGGWRVGNQVREAQPRTGVSVR